MLSTVSVISDSNNAVVANLTVGNDPTVVAYDSGVGEIFVGNSGSVSVISDSSNTVVATIPAGTSSSGMAYDSGKGEIFYSNLGSASVSVISDSNNAVIFNSSVYGAVPTGMAYDSGKEEIFVGASAANTVYVMTDSPFSVGVSALISLSPGSSFYSGEVSGTLYQGQTLKLESSVTSGMLPYTYQWLSEAPNASSFSPIGGATSSSSTISDYNFVTSTSTATGGWAFMLQVTDNGGEAVNSTVTVNLDAAPTPAPTVTPTPVSTPTASPSSPPSPTPTVPEFPLVMTGAILLTAMTSAILFLPKKLKKEMKTFSCARRGKWRHAARF